MDYGCLCHLAEASAVQIKKKKPLKDRLAEREDKRKKELEEKRKQVGPAEPSPL